MTNLNADTSKLLFYYDMRTMYNIDIKVFELLDNNTTTPIVLATNKYPSTALTTGTLPTYQLNNDDVWCNDYSQYNPASNSCNVKKPLLLDSITKTVNFATQSGETNKIFNSFTFELWFAYTNNSSYIAGQITDIVKTLVLPGGFSAGLNFQSLSFLINYATPLTITNSATIDSGKWHYIGVTFKDKRLIINTVVDSTVGTPTNLAIVYY